MKRKKGGEGESAIYASQHEIFSVKSYELQYDDIKLMEEVKAF